MSQETANAFNVFKSKFDKLLDEFNKSIDLIYYHKAPSFNESHLAEVRKTLNTMVDKILTLANVLY